MIHRPTKLQNAIQILDTDSFCMKTKTLAILEYYTKVSKANSCAFFHIKLSVFHGVRQLRKMILISFFYGVLQLRKTMVLTVFSRCYSTTKVDIYQFFFSRRSSMTKDYIQTYFLKSIPKQGKVVWAVQQMDVGRWWQRARTWAARWSYLIINHTRHFFSLSQTWQ
jgi:hypothetical protein